MEFNYFDILVVIILAFFAIRGLVRGFIKEFFSLIGLVGSIWLAFTYYPLLASALDFLQSVAWRNIVAYVIVFVAGILLAHLIINVLQRVFSLAFLTWADKLLGFCFGLCKGFLICAIVVILSRGFLADTSFAQGAITLPYLNMLMEYVQSHIPADMFDIF